MSRRLALFRYAVTRPYRLERTVYVPHGYTCVATFSTLERALLRQENAAKTKRPYGISIAWRITERASGERVVVQEGYT